MSHTVSATASLPIRTGAVGHRARAGVRPLADHGATLDHDVPGIFDGIVTFIAEHGYKD